MIILYCHSCDELYSEDKVMGEYKCHICGTADMSEAIDCKRGMELSDRLIEDLWELFGLCDYDPETETILENFLDFPAGTYREDVLHWFDFNYSKGVHELMYM